MRRILPAIVISQFFCTSLWFAGNAVMGDIAKQFRIDQSYLAYLTSMVQAGFIVGTFIFALLSIADRFSPVRVFFACAFIAAGINIGITLGDITLTQLMLLRFFTGFFLAGIYPVGMKIAADHYQQGLGKSLGFLVGALVLGTAFPHFLKSVMAGFPYRDVIYATSALSAFGGLTMVLLVPDGPYRKPGQRLKLNTFLQNFSNANFKSAALGYFGHMWELYAFWVFVPIILTAYNKHYPTAHLNVSLLSFFIIVVGSGACVCSGYISQRIGVKRTATIALTVSLLCCMVSPVVLFAASPVLLVGFMLIWSFAVIADSPMFSTLVAQSAAVESKGTALTIVNCIGFAITIVSIQLVNALQTHVDPQYVYIMLAAGPVTGLTALTQNERGITA